MKPNIKKAKRHLEALRELASKRKRPFDGMTEDQAIERIRKTRKELWDKKLASRS
jgi:hypothetical protein